MSNRRNRQPGEERDGRSLVVGHRIESADPDEVLLPRNTKGERVAKHELPFLEDRPD